MKTLTYLEFPDAPAASDWAGIIPLNVYKRFRLLALQYSFFNNDAVVVQTAFRMGTQTNPAELVLPGSYAPVGGTNITQFVIGGRSSDVVPLTAEMRESFLPDITRSRDLFLRLTTTGAAYAIQNIRALVEYDDDAG